MAHDGKVDDLRLAVHHRRHHRLRKAVRHVYDLVPKLLQGAAYGDCARRAVRLRGARRQDVESRDYDRRPRAVIHHRRRVVAEAFPQMGPQSRDIASVTVENDVFDAVHSCHLGWTPPSLEPCMKIGPAVVYCKVGATISADSERVKRSFSTPEVYCITVIPAKAGIQRSGAKVERFVSSLLASDTSVTGRPYARIPLYGRAVPVTPNPTVAAMPFAVRALREADIAQVRAVEKEAFSTLFPPTSFRRELGNRAARYWVAEKRDERDKPSFLPVAQAGIVRKLLRPRDRPPCSAL